ncbi:MAG: hypothetical protein IJ518_07510, partial [Clostridia bacterium]|nr:hypothetical protein [Clostridia bacterium]
MKMIIKSVLLIHKIRYKHGVKARQTSDNFLLPSSPRDKSTLTAKITDCFCLSKPQAWHIITARSVVHIISPFGAVSHHALACIYLRLDDIQHFVLV